MTLPNHINYLHPKIEEMTILYFHHNLSCICYYILHIDKWSDIFLLLYLILPLITLISVKRSNLTLVFLKAACRANPRTERNFAGSSSYI